MSQSFEEKLKNAFLAIQGVAIPDAPEELLALERELNARYPNTQNMINIIQRNTVLAGELLKLVNSPFIHGKQKVVSISQAVSVLGTKNLKNLFVAAALKHYFGSASVVRELLDHSADVAFCCAELAYFIEGVSVDEAYTTGLFHNGGAILLSNKDQEKYHQIFLQSQSLPLSSIIKEEALFETDHTVVGLLLANKWHLTKEMAYAIYYHHIDKCARIVDNDKTRLLVAMLKVANAIVSEISLGAYIGSEMNDYFKDGMETLMLTNDQVKEVRMALQTYSMGFA